MTPDFIDMRCHGCNKQIFSISNRKVLYFNVKTSSWNERPINEAEDYAKSFHLKCLLEGLPEIERKL